MTETVVTVSAGRLDPSCLFLSIILQSQKAEEPWMVRRMPHNLVITIPPASPSSRQPAASTSSWRSGGGRRGILLRIFPWIVGCTIVLWIFVLRADRPPLRDYTALPHRPIDGHKPRPFHPPYKGQALSPTATWTERAKSVRGSCIHALKGYQTWADGYDELLPTTGGRTNKYVVCSLV